VLFIRENRTCSKPISTAVQRKSGHAPQFERGFNRFGNGKGQIRLSPLLSERRGSGWFCSNGASWPVVMFAQTRNTNPGIPSLMTPYGRDFLPSWCTGGLAWENCLDKFVLGHRPV